MIGLVAGYTAFYEDFYFVMRGFVVNSLDFFLKVNGEAGLGYDITDLDVSFVHEMLLTLEFIVFVYPLGCQEFWLGTVG